MTDQETVELAQLRLEASQNGGFAFVKDIPCLHVAPGDKLSQKLWWTPTGYVLTSASLRHSPLSPQGVMVHETYAFESNAEGEIAEWEELSGSVRGMLDHELVIRNVVQDRREAAK